MQQPHVAYACTCCPTAQVSTLRIAPDTPGSQELDPTNATGWMENADGRLAEYTIGTGPNCVDPGVMCESGQRRTYDLVVALSKVQQAHINELAAVATCISRAASENATVATMLQVNQTGALGSAAAWTAAFALFDYPKFSGVSVQPCG
jgi:hypothetical protein